MNEYLKYGIRYVVTFTSFMSITILWAYGVATQIPPVLTSWAHSSNPLLNNGITPTVFVAGLIFTFAWTVHCFKFPESPKHKDTN